MPRSASLRLHLPPGFESGPRRALRLGVLRALLSVRVVGRVARVASAGQFTKRRIETFASSPSAMKIVITDDPP